MPPSPAADGRPCRARGTPASTPTPRKSVTRRSGSSAASGPAASMRSSSPGSTTRTTPIPPGTRCMTATRQRASSPGHTRSTRRPKCRTTRRTATAGAGLASSASQETCSALSSPTTPTIRAVWWPMPCRSFRRPTSPRTTDPARGGPGPAMAATAATTTTPPAAEASRFGTSPTSTPTSTTRCS